MHETTNTTNTIAALPFTSPAPASWLDRQHARLARLSRKIARHERHASLLKLMRGWTMGAIVGECGPEALHAVAERAGLSYETVRGEMRVATSVPRDLWRMASYSALREIAALHPDRQREILATVIGRGETPSPDALRREMHERSIAGDPGPDPWTLDVRAWTLARAHRDWGAELPANRLPALADWAVNVVLEHIEAQARRPGPVEVAA